MAIAQDRTVRVKAKRPPDEAGAVGDAGDDIIRTRGLRFPPHPEIISGRVRRALRRGNYEKTEADAVRPHVTREDVVLELGGGIGFMSTLMARNCRAAHVHVYEANPALIPYMAQVHALNEVDNVTVHNAVVGPKKGKATFYQRANMLTSSLEEAPAKVSEPVIATHEIAVENINTVWNRIKPSVLVCDIEGGEAGLFDKAKLTGLRLAVIEVHPQWIGEHGTRGVFEAMHRAGLTYFPKASQGKVVVFKKDW